ncbi:hypothetical protein D3C72_2268320 [compost metagenome]
MSARSWQAATRAEGLVQLVSIGVQLMRCMDARTCWPICRESLTGVKASPRACRPWALSLA